MSDNELAIDQSIGWLKMYAGAITAENWKDMRDRIASELETLAADIVALRTAAASAEPVAWIAFAGNGNVRFWTADQARAKREQLSGMDLRMFTLPELVALAGRPAPDAEIVVALEKIVNYSPASVSQPVLIARAALAKAKGGSQSAWRPIETAPKDRFILVYCPEDGSRWMVKWQGGEWYGMDCQHGIRRTGHSLGDPDYVTGWFVSHWREIPEFSK